MLHSPTHPHVLCGVPAEFVPTPYLLHSVLTPYFSLPTPYVLHSSLYSVPTPYLLRTYSILTSYYSTLLLLTHSVLRTHSVPTLYIMYMLLTHSLPTPYVLRELRKESSQVLSEESSPTPPLRTLHTHSVRTLWSTCRVHAEYVRMCGGVQYRIF
jgi:hypothetical protein